MHALAVRYAWVIKAHIYRGDSLKLHYVAQRPDGKYYWTRKPSLAVSFEDEQDARVVAMENFYGYFVEKRMEPC